MPLLLLLLPSSSLSLTRVGADYLRKGSRRFYFNSCECGFIDGEEQDLK